MRALYSWKYETSRNIPCYMIQLNSNAISHNVTQPRCLKAIHPLVKHKRTASNILVCLQNRTSLSLTSIALLWSPKWKAQKPIQRSACSTDTPPLRWNWHYREWISMSCNLRSYVVVFVPLKVSGLPDSLFGWDNPQVLESFWFYLSFSSH